MDGFRRTWNRCAPHVLAGLLLVGMMLVSGCQTASSFTLRDRTWQRNRSEVTTYDRVDLVYEVNHSQTGLDQPSRPWHEVLTSAGRKNDSGNEMFAPANGTASPISAWCKARVQVVYPHPEGTPDMAQVTLRLSRLAPGEIETSYAGMFKRLVHRRVEDSKSLFGKDTPAADLASRPASRLDDEVWTTSLSKDQLDLLLAELTNNGFFGQQERPYACSELSLKVDHESICKSWTQEPRLNQLIEHTYQQGQLVGFVTPEAHQPLTNRKDRLMARFEKLPFVKASQETLPSDGIEQVGFEE